MKKLITVLLTLALAASFTACGNDENNTAPDNSSGTVSDSTDTGNPSQMNPDDDDKDEIEENLDAVANYLHLKDGKDTLYEVIGAKAGKEYNGGKVEIYQFDDDSAEYEKLKKGEGDLKIAAHNDGFILLFADEKDKDEDLIRKFEAIDFK